MSCQHAAVLPQFLPGGFEFSGQSCGLEQGCMVVGRVQFLSPGQQFSRMTQQSHRLGLVAGGVGTQAFGQAGGEQQCGTVAGAVAVAGLTEGRDASAQCIEQAIAAVDAG